MGESDARSPLRAIIHREATEHAAARTGAYVARFFNGGTDRDLRLARRALDEALRLTLR